MDRGAWRATVCGVTKSRTQLSDFHFHYCVGGVPKTTLRSDNLLERLIELRKLVILKVICIIERIDTKIGKGKRKNHTHTDLGWKL